VAGASAKVLAWFVPTSATALEDLVAQQSNAGPGNVHPKFSSGVAIGRAAADAILAHVAADGFTATWTGTVPVGPGLWTTSTLPPAGVMLGQVTPWFMTSGSQFRVAPPPAYLSPAFNADLAEVLAIRQNLTPAQLAIALGWAYGGGTYTPVGYWNELASGYVAADGLDEAAAVKVFGLMSAAVFDAVIAAFEAKYYYWTLRPHQANPAITTAFTVPNYPAYPSGHGSVSGASARVLAYFVPAHAAELNALVDEAAMSRIYAGIHYRFDMTAARSMAEAVADWVIAHGM
jgi:membrane-associated phospholipid phosphatase